MQKVPIDRTRHLSSTKNLIADLEAFSVDFVTKTIANRKIESGNQSECEPEHENEKLLMVIARSISRISFGLQGFFAGC